ncbi:MAG: HlyD family efflux transporter periplasmic adaptor subunit [Crocinitomicaceae bacterium TMED209]|nr:MAG: HlyD family efflux transporter periplasmic adaptor subunit [Crocinitomicaceae bacterium TMED209]
MKFTKKFWIISVVAIVVLGIAGKWYGGRETLDEVDVEQAAVRDIVERVSASGKIQPETEVNITAEVSGQILALPVKEGDRVEKGDLLVQINPDLYEAALNRAQAAANSARSNLASAKAQHAQANAQFFAAEKNWQRTQQLFRDKVVSQADYDTGEANFISAEATLTAASESIRSAEFAISSAEASVQEARDNLSRTTLLAPQSGTVTALVKEVGESVQGNGFTAGEVVMKVSDLSIMEVDVEVNESDIVRVGMNDKAEVEVDAYLDETFMGSVTEIGNTALNAGLNGFAMDQVTNFSVKVRLQPESYAELLTTLEDASSPFRPGMSAKVDVLTRSADAVVSVPIQSVTTRESETDEEEYELGVFVLEPSGEARWQRVETGIQDNRYIEIKSGLDTSLTVVTGPYQSVSRTLNDGDAVEIKDPEEAEEDQ